MTDSSIFPSMVLSIVGTIYTIFIAVIVFSAQYLDTDLKAVKKLLLDLLILSMIVFATIIFNGILLYFQSGGHFLEIQSLSKYFNYTDLLKLSWLSFALSVGYVFIFSYLLFVQVYVNVCLKKSNEIIDRQNKARKKIKKITRSYKKRSEKFEHSQRKIGSLEEIKCSLLNEYQTKENEISKKLKTIIEIANKRSKSFEFLMFPHCRFITDSLNSEPFKAYPQYIDNEVISVLEKAFNIKPDTNIHENPFKIIIYQIIDAKSLKGIPIEIIPHLEELLNFLENLSNKYDELLNVYEDLLNDINELETETEEIENRFKELEEEKKDLDNQIEELKNINPFDKLKRMIF